MGIYLDSNATTPVLPIARDAALAAMSDDFGNPSSTHSRGLRAKSLKENVRALARRVLDTGEGQMLFVSGATEAIQTAVLSALVAVRATLDAPGAHADIRWLLYGATEHKAVPEALAHWNAILGLNLELRAIPVGQDGRHDLAWLAQHARHAGLVCTMAANNETGVISDLQGIAKALEHSPALWLVDSVQALGKLPLQLQTLPIDYASFSGHKLYAPKGTGLLYVRQGTPFTPLMVGGGQEGALRSGTENMAGIAALGAIFEALENGTVFQSAATLDEYRLKLISALQDAFEGAVFNAPLTSSLPTTINFSVPNVGANVLLNLFDAAGVRVSGGSACGAAKAKPSYVLEAMGLPAWQVESAVRLSFGPADTPDFVDEACARIRACGEAMRRSGFQPGTRQDTPSADDIIRSIAESARPTVSGDTEQDGLPGHAIELQFDAATELVQNGQRQDGVLLLDVREEYEQFLSAPPDLGGAVCHMAAPMSRLAALLPELVASHAGRPIIVFCRSGNRSGQVARLLRRLGHVSAWSLAGGLALCSEMYASE